jgi:hypothetical protein
MMRFKSCFARFLVAACVLSCLARESEAATRPGRPAKKRTDRTDGLDKSSARPKEEEEEEDEATPADKKAGAPATKDRTKPRTTSIKDALTIDPDLHGVTFSTSKLGEPGDIVTTRALQESSRVAVEEGVAKEHEQITEDRRSVEHEAAVEEAEEEAEAEARAKAEAAAEKAAASREDRLWLLVGCGVVVLLAGAFVIFAMRKVLRYDE